MLDRLAFGYRRKLPLVLQTEAAECGLACVCMVAGYHGGGADLAALRRRFGVSLKGSTLAALMRHAAGMKLATRAVKLELDDVPQLRLPCILHWNFNHFVVLQSAGARGYTVYDPAQGVRRLSTQEFSAAFTGVALELWPAGDFTPEPRRQPVPLRRLLGRVGGLLPAFGQALLLALALEVFAALAPFFLQWVVDEVLVADDRGLLGLLALGFGALVLMQQAVGLMRGWVLMVLGTTVNLQWRANALAHLLRLPAEYFERRHLADVVSRFGSIDAIQKTLTTSFLEALLDGLMAAVTLGLMLAYSAALAAVTLSAMALYGLGRWLWYRPLRHATGEQIVHAARQQGHFLETVRGVKTLKLFQRQEERRQTWLALLVEQINADLRTQKLALLNQGLNGLLFGLENVLVIWLGARMVMAGHFSVGMLIAFCAYRTQFDLRVGALIDRWVEFAMLRLQGERLADILLTPTEATHDGAAAFGAELEPTLETRALSYRYAEGEPLVLEGVSLSIAAGESVAIAGPSGGGKTTLVNLLLGLLQPSAGEVLVGGRPLATVGLDALRRISGTALQDDVLFAGSVAENISCFDPQPDFDWIEQCARHAAIEADIQAMPMGYNTMIGDMGTALSGGQKQRLLIARALYKRPKILFLDEATSHLDVAREHQVSEAIRALKVTRIIVAHRPETIASADRVIALANGKIVASGVAPALERAGGAEAIAPPGAAAS